MLTALILTSYFRANNAHGFPNTRTMWIFHPIYDIKVSMFRIVGSESRHTEISSGILCAYGQLPEDLNYNAAEPEKGKEVDCVEPFNSAVAYYSVTQTHCDYRGQDRSPHCVQGHMGGIYVDTHTHTHTRIHTQARIT